MPDADDPLAGVGVVIVAYRSAAVIAEGLGALALHRLADVVVVDNDSPDDTVAVVRALGLPTVRVVEAGENLGFGGGCNRGLAELDPAVDLVLFLNPDAAIDERSLERLVSYLSANPSCALVAPRMRRDGRAIHSAGRVGTLATEIRPLLPREIGWVLPARQLPPDACRTGPVGYTEGACMLVRRSALTAVGGFDERFFLYFEELDLAHAFRRRGWTVDLCCEAEARHAVGTATAELPLSGRPVMIGSTVAYLRKWRGPRAVRAYALAARASWWLRVRTGDLDPGAAQRLRTALRAAVAGDRVVA